jgi:hypothetical protein
MIMSQEQLILKGREQFEQLLSLVQSGRVQSLNEVEHDLFTRLLGLGRSLLELKVAAMGTGDVGPTLTLEGRTLRRLEKLHDRRYVSIFGELTIHRHVYGTRETQKHEAVPLDAKLNLPENDHSYLLQQWDQSFCVKSSFKEAGAGIKQILGLGQSVRTLEQMNRHMADSAENFRLAQPAPPAAEEGSILVLTGDCKGVPMRRPADEPAPSGRLGPGQKPCKKQMAAVGGVYTIEPFVRTAEEVVDEVMHEKAQERRPKPQNKQLRAELTRQIEGKEANGKDAIFKWFAEQTRQRNAGGNLPVVCVMDGERALWNKLSTFLMVSVVCILDIFHVLERLWQAAHCFFPENSPEAKAFVTERLRRILCGEVGRVIGGLRQMGTKQKLKGSKQRQLAGALRYLENNRKFMRYDEYLAAGYPIGSGVAEGACRHLVKDRMELTGMRWTVAGAQAMLQLRAIHVNDQWETFNQHRIEAESVRLYPYAASLRMAA